MASEATLIGNGTTHHAVPAHISPKIQQLVIAATYYLSDPSPEVQTHLIRQIHCLTPPPHFTSREHLNDALSCLMHPALHNVEAALRCLYAEQSFGTDTEKLGQGATASVWKREFTASPDLDSMMGTSPPSCVAAKEFRPKDRNPLKHELHMLEKCTGVPHILQLELYSRRTPDILYLQWAEGGSLQPGIGTFSAEKCLCIIREIAEGIQSLHQLGILHRDIKPANILLSKDKHPIIGDLGSSIEKKNFTTQNEYPGSPLFFSPELAQALIPCFKNGALIKTPIPEHLLEKIDVWAFGMLLFELFKNEDRSLYPFGDQDTHSFLFQLSKYHHPFTEELYDQTLNAQLCQEKDPDGKLIAVMKRCLIFDPTARPSMEEIIASF